MISRSYVIYLSITTIACYVLFCQMMEFNDAAAHVLMMQWANIYTGYALAQRKHLMKIMLGVYFAFYAITELDAGVENPFYGWSVALSLIMSVVIVFKGMRIEMENMKMN